MTEKKVIGSLSALSLLTVTGVCFLAFLLSYDVLWSYALDGGKPEWLAMLWPLIIDLPIAAFSIVAMLFAFLGSRLSWFPRIGVFALACLTVYFNYTYAAAHDLSWKVAISAPIMYAVSFECVILVIGLLTSRSIDIKKVGTIRAELDKLQARWDNERDKIDKKRGQLTGQLDNIKGQIASQKETMNRLKQETKEASQRPTLTYLPDNLPVNIRQQIVKKMVNDRLTNRQMAAMLGVSEGTIKGDKKALANGHDLG